MNTSRSEKGPVNFHFQLQSYHWRIIFQWKYVHGYIARADLHNQLLWFWFENVDVKLLFCADKCRRRGSLRSYLPATLALWCGGDGNKQTTTVGGLCSLVLGRPLLFCCVIIIFIFCQSKQKSEREKRQEKPEANLKQQTSEDSAAPLPPPPQTDWAKEVSNLIYWAPPLLLEVRFKKKKQENFSSCPSGVIINWLLCWSSCFSCGSPFFFGITIADFTCKKDIAIITMGSNVSSANELSTVVEAKIHSPLIEPPEFKMCRNKLGSPGALVQAKENKPINTYEGERSKDGKRHGKGQFKWENGVVYVGEWKDDKMDGDGIMMYPDGTVCEGTWKDNKQNGKGKIKWPSGDFYEGDWCDDKRTGKVRTPHPLLIPKPLFYFLKVVGSLFVSIFFAFQCCRAGWIHLGRRPTIYWRLCGRQPNRIRQKHMAWWHNIWRQAFDPFLFQLQRRKETHNTLLIPTSI